MRMLDEIIATLNAGERAMLATIVAARGSTPVGASSRLLVRDGGMSVGTIGGGCTEGEIIQRARRLLGTGAAELVTLSLDEESGDGLICGGSIDVLLEEIAPADLPCYRDLALLAERGEDAVLATLLADGGRVAGRAITAPAPLAAEVRWHAPGSLPFLPAGHPGVEREVLRALRGGEPVRASLPGGALFLEPWTAPPRLFIFGGGHVGRALCRAAAAVGFRVTVVDDRAKYASPERFPEAATLVADPSTAVAAAGVGAGSYVAVVTRGHAHDETVLAQALRTDARYIGMIGSAKKVLASMTRLHAAGIPVAALRRVHAPIGLAIGAVTAEEIAVSIVAQLIRVRRGAAGGAFDKSDDLRPLLEALEPSPLIATRP